jgi:hypothetical protein
MMSQIRYLYIYSNVLSTVLILKNNWPKIILGFVLACRERLQAPLIMTSSLKLCDITFQMTIFLEFRSAFQTAITYKK